MTSPETISRSDISPASVPLLLVSGMMCDAGLWQEQIEVIQQSRAVSVVTFSNEATIADMAETAIKKMIDLFPTHLPVAVAGLSMGGIVAFEMWRRCPKRIAGLAFLNTTHLPDSPERRIQRERQINAARDGQLYWLLRDELKPSYPGVGALPATVMNMVMAMALRMGPTAFIAQSRALRDRLDSTATLGTITCQTLVMCGDSDVLCPVSRHQEIADAIPTAALVVLPDCGHLSTLESPKEVITHLQSWLHNSDYAARVQHNGGESVSPIG